MWNLQEHLDHYSCLVARQLSELDWISRAAVTDGGGCLEDHRYIGSVRSTGPASRISKHDFDGLSCTRCFNMRKDLHGTVGSSAAGRSKIPTPELLILIPADMPSR